MRMIQRLWTDEYGFIISSELILIATILVIAMVVGLGTVRDAVLQEPGDVGAAIGAISQDVSCGGATGHCLAVNGWGAVDDIDHCEFPTNMFAVNSRNCVDVCVGAVGEGAQYRPPREPR